MNNSRESQKSDILASLCQESSGYVSLVLTSQISPNETVSTVLVCCYDMVDYLHHDTILEYLISRRCERKLARIAAPYLSALEKLK